MGRSSHATCAKEIGGKLLESIVLPGTLPFQESCGRLEVGL